MDVFAAWAFDVLERSPFGADRVRDRAHRREREKERAAGEQLALLATVVEVLGVDRAHVALGHVAAKRSRAACEAAFGRPAEHRPTLAAVYAAPPFAPGAL